MTSKMDQLPISRPAARSLERTLLAVGGALLCAPLLLAILFTAVPDLWPDATWLHDTTLVGVGFAHPAPFSWGAFLHARYQRSLEETFDDGYPGRELLIRLANEAWWRCFGSISLAGDNPVVAGRNSTLFQSDFLREYCCTRPPADTLTKFAGDLERLQAGCRQRGVAFAVLISPSKAAIYPERIPNPWMSLYDGRPRAYDVFRALAAKHGIACVDGHAITMQAKPTAIAPLFARGATHWNPQAAFLAGNALLRLLHDQGQPLQPMEIAQMRVSDRPQGAEKDILGLLNLAFDWNYPVVELALRPRQIPENSRLNAVFVGTSFTTAPAKLLSESGQFAEIDHFDASRRDKCSYRDGQEVLLSTPAPPPDFAREVFSADALIIEINEAALAAPDYAQQFVDDALRFLAAPPRARAAFAAQIFETYAWGQELSFQQGAAGEADRHALAGFSGPEPAGTWMEGSRGAVRLLAPPPSGDVVLDACAAGFADPALGLEQEVEVSVNDHPIGKWEFTGQECVKRSLVVPWHLLKDGPRVVLGFRVSHPTSPAEHGLGSDERRLGLRLSTLCLRPIPAMACEWGRLVTFGSNGEMGRPKIDRTCLSGFSAAQPNGAWTDGSTAVLHLKVPNRTAGDLILRVEASALLDSRANTPGQQAAVYVNDERVTEWCFTDQRPHWLEARLPHRLVDDSGALRVRVEIANPVSPAELGQSDDWRKLGLFFYTLGLQPADGLVREQAAAGPETGSVVTSRP
jgi:hypothetical protein